MRIRSATPAVSGRLYQAAAFWGCSACISFASTPFSPIRCTLPGISSSIAMERDGAHCQRLSTMEPSAEGKSARRFDQANMTSYDGNIFQPVPDRFRAAIRLATWRSRTTGKCLLAQRLRCQFSAMRTAFSPTLPREPAVEDRVVNFITKATVAAGGCASLTAVSSHPHANGQTHQWDLTSAASVLSVAATRISIIYAGRGLALTSCTRLSVSRCLITRL